ncbi:RNA polymerase sigma-70 factor [Chitinophaga sp. MM2321]|uniref:RNA polymerase sigma factor n=1 Tax=Chitinophaga sp. MM2321 TaxID=3137178 RepID=UPI0032D57681
MSTERKQEESILMSLLAKDSEYAFRLLYDRYSNRIYKLAIRYLKSPVLAQEIVQDVFLKLWFERKNMITDKPVEAWLITVAKNKLINQFKKLTREWNRKSAYNADVPINKSTDGESKLLNAEFERNFNSIINGLPQQQKQILHFTKEEGLSYNEIALRLNISPLTVKTHMARALDKIRKCLKEL